MSSGDVPIQGNDTGPNGGPGSTVQLQNPGGAVNLQCGPIQPVSQLGYLLPDPREHPPSILPPPGGNLQATYVFPELEKVP